ncbi:MAG: GDSL-type esterase/lipase family protein, partial [Erysipelotrichaceae bacterium]
MPTELMYVAIGVALVILASLAAIAYGKKMRSQGFEAGQNELRQEINTSTHRNRMDEFESLNQIEKKKGIVFVGDSLTQGYNVYEYYPQLPVYNRGIYGDSTVGCAARLQQSVYALHPKGVVLLIGVNDLSVFRSAPHEIAQRIDKIIQSIREQLPDVTIWVLSLLPVSKEVHPKINAA